MNLGVENETTEFKSSMSQLDKGIIGLTAMLNWRPFVTESVASFNRRLFQRYPDTKPMTASHTYLSM